MFYPAADDDVPGIVTLMNRAYRGAGAAGWSTQESDLSGDRITEDVLRADLIANPQASLLKWEEPEGGPLLGCVWIEPLDDDVWYLGSLATDPTLQKSGLGKILLSAAEDGVRDRGGEAHPNECRERQGHADRVVCSAWLPQNRRDRALFLWRRSLWRAAAR